MTMDPTPPTDEPDDATAPTPGAAAPDAPPAEDVAEDVAEDAARAEPTAPMPAASEEPVAPAQARGPQAQQPAEPGWWIASDGQWYPPESAPAAQPQYADPAAPVAAGQYATAGQPPAPYPQQYPAAYPPGAQPKSRMAAGLLGIFLGGLGVHRFYLGYTNIGIIQIVVTVFTCGLGSLWGFVEGILILMKNESFLTDADGVPLTD